MSRLKDRETEEETPVIEKGGISDRENSMCKDSEAREKSSGELREDQICWILKCEGKKMLF